MKELEWKKEMSVGVEEIDDQHKHLFKIFNKIQDKETEEALNDFIEYTRVHFTTEEEYFEKTKYPGAEEHANIHAEITKKLLSFSNSFKEQDEEKINEFLEEFSKELLDHLFEEDSKYAKYFEEIEFDG
jgi:hemerythrin